jgi:hypothetical protein
VCTIATRSRDRDVVRLRARSKCCKRNGKFISCTVDSYILSRHQVQAAFFDADVDEEDIEWARDVGLFVERAVKIRFAKRYEIGASMMKDP